jgi:hypothetical protein
LPQMCLQITLHEIGKLVSRRTPFDQQTLQSLEIPELIAAD